VQNMVKDILSELIIHNIKEILKIINLMVKENILGMMIENI